MNWVTGRLVIAPKRERLQLLAGPELLDLKHGDVGERWRGSRWERGRVEFSGLLGWLWTNERVYYCLMGGDEVRIWAGENGPELRQPVHQN